MDSSKSIETLALEVDKNNGEKSFEDQYYNGKRDPSTTVLAIFVIIFVFLSLIFWAGLSICRPTWCTSGNYNLDKGKAFGAALLIAFVVLIVIAIVWSFTGGINTHKNGKGLAISLVIILLLIIILCISWTGLYWYK